MKIRCSSLPKIITNSRSKSELLSETAKSYIKQLAKEDFYGYSTELNNKYVNKGISQENESIELLNSVMFTDYKKNDVRIENEFLTGECDINANNLIIDIKTSWSLDTFPCLSDDINIKDYEMQLRGYMMLYDVDNAVLAYCMVDTPDELCTYENQDIHKVSHIAPEKRVTMLSIERDLEIEKQIEERCKVAIEYYTSYINQLNAK